MSLSHCHGLMFRSHRKPIEQEIAELQRKFRVLDAWLNETLVEAARSQHSQVLTFESLDFDSILYVPDSPKTDASSGFVGSFEARETCFPLRRTTSELAVKILKAPSVNTRGFHRRSSQR